ncbi:MAG: hypothetical protein VCE43_15570, partial [Myxococcota bacterium]
MRQLVEHRFGSWCVLLFEDLSEPSVQRYAHAVRQRVEQGLANQCVGERVAAALARNLVDYPGRERPGKRGVNGLRWPVV